MARAINTAESYDMYQFVVMVRIGRTSSVCATVQQYRCACLSSSGVGWVEISTASPPAAGAADPSVFPAIFPRNEPVYNISYFYGASVQSVSWHWS